METGDRIKSDIYRKSADALRSLGLAYLLEDGQAHYCDIGMCQQVGNQVPRRLRNAVVRQLFPAWLRKIWCILAATGLSCEL